MKRKHVQFTVSLLITAFFLYLAFRGIPLNELGAALRNVAYVWTIPLMAITLLSMYFRTLRWKYLLEPVVDVPSRKIFSPLIICFFLNSILPGRAGEFARAYLVSRDHKAPFSSSFATVVVERMADALGLLVFFVILLAIVPLDPKLKETWGSVRQVPGSQLILWVSIGLALLIVVLVGIALLILGAKAQQTRAGSPRNRLAGLLHKIRRTRLTVGALFGMAAICLLAILALAAGLIINPDGTYKFGQEYVIDAAMLRGLSKKMLVIGVVLLAGSLLMLWSPFERFVQGVIRRVPLLPTGFKDALNRFIETFVHGFHSLRSPRLIFWVVVHTATVWLAVGWSVQLTGRAFPGTGLANMTFIQGMAISIIICIAILIPAAPGYWGLYEVGTILAVQLLGLVPATAGGRATALSFALVLHFFQMLPLLVLGAIFLWKRQVGLAEIAAAEEAVEEAEEVAEQARHREEL